MLLWFVLTLMTSLAAVWLAAPLLAKLDEKRSAAANSLEVYRDQLAEVARERADGLIDAAQADAADVEIKRRLLSAERELVPATAPLSLGEQHFALASVIGIVVLGSAILYSNTGRPDLPSVAHGSTALVLDEAAQNYVFKPADGGAAVPGAAGMATAARPAAQVGGAAKAGPAGLGSVDDMIQRLVDRLKKEPGNADMWRMLGWSYSATGRYLEAVDAYKKGLEIQPRNGGLLSSYAEAQVRAANGRVLPDSVTAIDNALAVEPKDVRARYLKGLQQEQGGDKKAALETWIGVLNDGAASDPAATAELRGTVTKLAAELGVDVSARIPVAAAPAGGMLETLKNDGKAEGGAAAPLAAPVAPPSGRGPSADDVKSAEAMSPADRQGMIQNMVDKLAARLEASPRDAEGWVRLIRSRKVLGDGDAAKAALVKALGVFSDSPDEQKRITAGAAESGVTP